MEFDEIINHLFGKREQKPYFSVLEERSMENPRYREHLESAQALQKVYPELWLAGRGGTAPQRAFTGMERGIGSQVPKGYVPYTQMHEWDQRMFMDLYKLRNRNRPPSLDALIDEIPNGVNRTAYNSAMMFNPDGYYRQEK